MSLHIAAAHYTADPQVLHLTRRDDLRSVLLDFLLDAPLELRIQYPDQNVDDPDHKCRRCIQHSRPGVDDCIAEAGREKEAQTSLDRACDEKTAAEPEMDVRRYDHPRMPLVEFVVQDFGGRLDCDEAEQDQSDGRMVVM